MSFYDRRLRLQAWKLLLLRWLRWLCGLVELDVNSSQINGLYE